jgi:hypothetical protein
MLGTAVRLRLIALIIAISLVASCSRISTISEGIYIPGDAPVAEKLTLAEQIGSRVWESGLQEKVKTAYPGLDSEQLKGIFIRWGTITVSPISGEDEAPSTGVRILTGVQYRGKLDNASEIAAFCGDIVEQAISEHFNGVHKIHRLNFSEQSLAL